ncbi:MAG: ABC transporter substrate-binding protein [Caldilineaceae bacterium]|nr:ABC transporter substrate-binding protein [Caldilineaceae bacterium]
MSKIQRLVALVAVLILTACSGGATSGGAATTSGTTEQAETTSTGSTIVVVIESGPNSLDIQGIGTNRPAYGLSWNVYDRLLTYGKTTLPTGEASYDYQVLEPELAESWEVAEDGMSATFYLRKDALFHDGSPVTAHDVKWSFDRALAVGGFATFQMQAGSLEQPEQFVVVDDHTFRVDFLRPDRLTIPDLAVPVPAIYNSKLAKEHATAADPWALEWLKSNEAGSGAYKIESWKPGEETIYVRFEEWKSGPLPHAQRVIVREIPSASTRRALLERGDVDISFDLPPKDVAEMAEATDLQVIGVPIENSMWYVGMNVTQPPFDNVLVRKAVAAALPYDKIISAAWYGRGIPLYGAASAEPATTDWPQPYPNTTDREAAKALLAEAGYPDGFETTLSFDLGLATVGEPMALLVQESLAEIGITTTLEKVPGANWRGAMLEKKMPLIINFFGGWLNYPEYFFFWTYHGQNAVFNTMSYQNPAMDELIDGARFTQDDEAYADYVRGFIGIAMDEVPRIPLVQPYLDVALQPNIKGYQYWFHRQLDFRQLVKE